MAPKALTKNLLFLLFWVFLFDLSKVTRTAPGSLPPWMSYFSSDLGKWAYILLFDLLPALGIVVWVRRQLKRAPAHEPSSAKVNLEAQHSDPLLTLRFSAFLMVFLGHYFLVVFPDTRAIGDISARGFFMLASPWSGLWLFFTLSGYLMGKGFFSGRYPLDDHGVSRFYLNRAFRIFPVYLVVVFLVCLAGYRAIFHPDNLWMLLKILSLDNQANLPISPDSALWSISTEFQFYLLSPFIALALLRLDPQGRRTLQTLVCVLALGMAVRHVALHQLGLNYSRWLYTPMVFNLDCFVGGMLLSRYRETLKQRAYPGKAKFLLWGMLLLPVFYLPLPVLGSKLDFAGKFQVEYSSYAPTAACALTLLIILFFELADLRAAAPRHPILTRVVRATHWPGILTFCLYVFHEPILLAMRRLAPESITFASSLKYLLPSAILITLAATLCYYGVEEPFSRRKRTH